MRIKIVALTALVVSLAAAAFADSPKCPVNYGYSGFAGPSQWKNFEANCGGTTQSPVTLAPVQQVTGERLEFKYRPSQMNVANSGHDFRAVLTDNSNNLLTVPGLGEGFRLSNFHFHTPNEHVLPKHDFQGELHLVHQRGDEIVAVGFFIRVGTAENKALAPFFDALPLDLCATTKNAIDFDPNVLLRTVGTVYYTYTGSLTTPACTPNVRFFIYPVAIEIGPNQYKKLIRFGKNARPVQTNTNKIQLVRTK